MYLDIAIIIFFFTFMTVSVIYNIVLNFHLLNKKIQLLIRPPSIKKPKLIDEKYLKLNDFLTGYSKHTFIDASLSLFMSNISPTIFLGGPTNIYKRGLSYFIGVLVFPISISFVNIVFLPTFYNLQLKSSNQYLELRFNATLRLICIIFHIIGTIIRVGLWLSLPTFILTNFIPIKAEIALYFLATIMISYTALGGMEVIHKMERFQFGIMFFALVSLITQSISNVGGLSNVFHKNYTKNRFNFDFDLNPFTDKYTIWTIISSQTFSFCSLYSIQQSTLTRYMPSANINIAKRILWVQIPIMIIFYLICCFIGLVMYAFYAKCDPFLIKRIERLEMLLALFCSDMSYYHKGLLGLFTVALYSIVLSSTSSSVNGITTMFFEDIIKPYFGYLPRQDLLIKLFVVVFGVITTSMFFIVKTFNDTLKLRSLLNNMIISPMFGVYILGLNNRKCNSKAALLALFIGYFLSFSLVITQLIHKKNISTNVQIDDCFEIFCQRNTLNNEKYQGCDKLPNNTWIINPTLIYERINLLNTDAKSYSFEFNPNIFINLSYQHDGWLITGLTILIGCLCSRLFFKQDKTRDEIENCLAIYRQKQCKPHKIEFEYEFEEKDDETTVDFKYVKEIVEDLIENQKHSK